jgi:hypothetical protein
MELFVRFEDLINQDIGFKYLHDQQHTSLLRQGRMEVDLLYYYFIYYNMCKYATTFVVSKQEYSLYHTI